MVPFSNSSASPFIRVNTQLPGVGPETTISLIRLPHLPLRLFGSSPTIPVAVALSPKLIRYFVNQARRGILIGACVFLAHTSRRSDTMERKAPCKLISIGRVNCSSISIQLYTSTRHTAFQLSSGAESRYLAIIRTSSLPFWRATGLTGTPQAPDRPRRSSIPTWLMSTPRCNGKTVT